jgi:hypothetical protein
MADELCLEEASDFIIQEQSSEINDDKAVKEKEVKEHVAYKTCNSVRDFLKRLYSANDAKSYRFAVQCFENITFSGVIFYTCLTIIILSCIAIWFIGGDIEFAGKTIVLCLVIILVVRTVKGVQYKVEQKITQPCMADRVFPDFPFNFSNKLYCVMSFMYVAIVTILTFIFNAIQTILVILCIYLIFRSFLFYRAAAFVDFFDFEIPYAKLCFEPRLFPIYCVGYFFYYRQVVKKRSFRIFKSIIGSILLALPVILHSAILSILFIEYMDRKLFFPSYFVGAKVLPVLKHTLNFQELDLYNITNMKIYGTITIITFITVILYSVIFIDPTNVSQECTTDQYIDSEIDTFEEKPYEKLSRYFQLGVALMGVCIIVAFFVLIFAKRTGFSTY